MPPPSLRPRPGQQGFTGETDQDESGGLLVHQFPHPLVVKIQGHCPLVSNWIGGAAGHLPRLRGQSGHVISVNVRLCRGAGAEGPFITCYAVPLTGADKRYGPGRRAIVVKFVSESLPNL